MGMENEHKTFASCPHENCLLIVIYHNEWTLQNQRLKAHCNERASIIYY